MKKTRPLISYHKLDNKHDRSVIRCQRTYIGVDKFVKHDLGCDDANDNWSIKDIDKDKNAEFWLEWW